MSSKDIIHADRVISHIDRLIAFRSRVTSDRRYLSFMSEGRYVVRWEKRLVSLIRFTSKLLWAVAFSMMDCFYKNPMYELSERHYYRMLKCTISLKCHVTLYRKIGVLSKTFDAKSSMHSYEYLNFDCQMVSGGKYSFSYRISSPYKFNNITLWSM